MDASALAPFRYLEFPLSIMTSLIFFQELPTWYTIMGALIIIPSMLLVAFYEFYKKNPIKIDKKPLSQGSAVLYERKKKIDSYFYKYKRDRYIG